MHRGPGGSQPQRLPSVHREHILPSSPSKSKSKSQSQSPKFPSTPPSQKSSILQGPSTVRFVAPPVFHPSLAALHCIRPPVQPRLDSPNRTVPPTKHSRPTSPRDPLTSTSTSPSSFPRLSHFLSLSPSPVQSSPQFPPSFLPSLSRHGAAPTPWSGLSR
jgi:hypothetical protein